MSEQGGKQGNEQGIEHIEHIAVDGADVVWVGEEGPTTQEMGWLSDIVAAAREAYESLPQEVKDRYAERSARGRERIRRIREALEEDL